MSSGGEFGDRAVLLRSNSSESEGDLERGGALSPARNSNTSNKGCFPSDLLKRFDRGLSGSGRRLSVKLRPDREHHRLSSSSPSSPAPSDHGVSANAAAADDILTESAPPEWALLLFGCLLGVATGLCVAAFNRGVHVIHEWAWAGTPNEGAAWLRLQRLADTWHRILLIPVLGGVVVGVLHGLLEIMGQIKQSTSSQGQRLDVLAAIFPMVKAVQAAVTLGTGCSLGPEGPSVDIGKSCANGFSVMMESNRERRIALVAAGAAAGIASGFNAAVAGCFFAIETVLRPLRAENSPPFTTAMIILASVISSTVSNAVLGDMQTFTVPTYDLKSAAELPLYLILGMLCGVVSVVFTRLLDWFTLSIDVDVKANGELDITSSEQKVIDVLLQKATSKGKTIDIYFPGRRQWLYVVAADSYNSNGSPTEALPLIIKNVMQVGGSKSNQIGFVLLTGLSLTETKDMLTNYQVNLEHFDALVCSSGSEMYYPWRDFEVDEDHESHIGYRWPGENIKSMVMRLAQIESGPVTFFHGVEERYTQR